MSFPTFHQALCQNRQGCMKATGPCSFNEMRQIMHLRVSLLYWVYVARCWQSGTLCETKVGPVQPLPPLAGPVAPQRDTGHHRTHCQRKGRRCSRCWSRDTPVIHGKDHGGAVISLQPVTVTMPQLITTLQPVEEPTPHQVAVTWRNCSLQAAPQQSRFILEGLHSP